MSRIPFIRNSRATPNNKPMVSRGCRIRHRCTKINKDMLNPATPSNRNKVTASLRNNSRSSKSLRSIRRFTGRW